MSKELTLYDVSRMLKEGGFEQPELASGQHWYSGSGSAVLVSAVNTLEFFGTQVVFITQGRFETLDFPIPERAKVLFHTYRPTIEDIMLRLPPTACLRHTYAEDDADVRWWICSPNMHKIDTTFIETGFYKHPVITCALAWLHFNSKSDHG